MAKVFPVLEGKTAIVTGAAMGMGEATARVFAQAKANVVIADFTKKKAVKLPTTSPKNLALNPVRQG